MQTIAAAVVLWSLLSAIGLFALSRRKRAVTTDVPDLRYVLLIPCLNEGKVIGATVRHLLRHPVHAVVVIDDGSDDDTAAQVQAVRDRRVVLLRRTLPDARCGKGEALNAAYRWLLGSDLVAGLDPASVIVSVVDADGRLKPGALKDVAASFADPATGACQISVRIRNRATNFWTRMQHFEFVAFTALYQRGRERTGAVGLGGNGQFVRLSALADLGNAPWTACLTEDMDVGIRLLLAGWRNRYMPTSWVSQQAVPEFGRLVRQRTRWFQGTLQCLGHIPGVMAAHRLPLRTRVDLIGALLSPVMLLVASPALFLGWFWIARAIAASESGGTTLAASLLTAYAISALPAVLLAYAFWIEEPEATFPEAVVLGHLFVAYGYIWIFSGWRAAWRQLRGARGWAKTARVDESDEAPTPTVVRPVEVAA